MATKSQPFRQYSESGEDVCALCCQESSAWAVGSCDHFVCLTCSARLRVLCEKKECPICRERNDKVVVLQKPQSFFVPHQSLKDRKYGFIFAKSSLINYYESIKAIRCNKCGAGCFAHIKQLFEHTRREHGLSFCEICVEHLKLFPSEHKMYSRQELVRHRREGDPDDKSHKGHPQCEFCDERYFGKDELFFHLKKNHFWCHFCEQMGTQEYYLDYHALRNHFRSEHYLCEEGQCRHEKFTNVFLSKLDLQAHKAKVHTKGLSKTEAKQLRHVDVGFTYARKERDSSIHRSRQHQPPADYTRDLETAIGLSLNQQADVKEQQQGEEPPVVTDNQMTLLVKSDPKGGGGGGNDNFPLLGAKPLKEEQVATHKNPSDKVKVKKPPGLEHVVAPAVVMGVASKIKPSDQEDDDDEGRDEWPSLGIKSLQTPPLGQQGFSWTNNFSVGPPPGLPVVAPPPGLNSDGVFLNEHDVPVKSSEYDVLKDAVELLNHDPEKINYFKFLSGQFQKSSMSVTEYSKRCSKLFGKDWGNFCIRLATTLPSQAKRQELMSVLTNKEQLTTTNTAVPKPPPGFTTINTSTTSSTSGTTSDANAKENKKSMKKRNRKAVNSSKGVSGVWQSTSSIKNPLNEAEFPSLGESALHPAHSGGRGEVITIPAAWNMKVATVK